MDSDLCNKQLRHHLNHPHLINLVDRQEAYQKHPFGRADNMATSESIFGKKEDDRCSRRPRKWRDRRSPNQTPKFKLKTEKDDDNLPR